MTEDGVTTNMAAHLDPLYIHDETKVLKRPLDESCSFGGVRNDGSETSSDPSTVTPSSSLSRFDDQNDLLGDVALPGPLTKKTRLVDAGGASPAHLRADDDLDRPRQPSPTDVRADPLAMASGWGDDDPRSGIRAVVPAMPTAYRSSGGRVDIIPPTLRGIIDAAAVLRASTSPPKLTASDAASPPPSLLSFPTESVYMLACCVRTVSSRSVRMLSSDSHASLSSSCSSSRGNEGHPQEEQAAHRGGGCPGGGFVHPPNASLDWMMECIVGVRPAAAAGAGAAPLLFVLDGHHALGFCHFTKPKTFAIRPPPPARSPGAPDGVGIAAPTPTSPSTPIAGSRGATMDARGADGDPPSLPATPTRRGPLAPGGKPTTSPSEAPAGTPNGTGRRLQAASFSESREAFLRLASKFWPGPVVIHVRVRTLGGEEEGVAVPDSAAPPPPSSSSSSSSAPIASFPEVPSIGDLEAEAGGGGAADPPARDDAASRAVPVLPESALLPASRLLEGRDDDSRHDRDGDDRERRGKHFVGMQCPSHPLSRKILNEAYRGAARPKVSHSESADSLASASSADENACAQRGVASSSPSRGGGGNRARSVGVAVVGLAAPAPPTADGSTAPWGATTAEDVSRAMASAVGRDGSGGRVFVVDGEDNRESFSVPTCQYGELHPVSLIVDGDSRTVHLIRRGGAPVAREDAADASCEGAILSVASVQRALLKPAASFHSLDAITEKRGDGSGTIDRVITAVLSRWKIQESTIGS